MEHVKSGLVATAIVSALGLFTTIGAAAQAPSQDAVAPTTTDDYDGPPLLFGGHAKVGGYGGFSTAYTHMLDHNGALIGVEGALLLAHRLSFGLAGYGFSRAPSGPAALDGSERRFGVGYGGFVVRYAFLTHLPVYPSLGVLIGGGAVVLTDEDFDDGDDHDDDENEQADGFFVFQPELSFHTNLTRWMRLGVTAGYRVTGSVHRFGLQESEVNGVTLGGNVQFGWF